MSNENGVPPGVQGQLIEVRLWGKRNIGGQMVEAEKLAVEYQYQVRGQKHIGRAPAFYTLMYPETLNFSKRLAVGGDVEVRYNPAEPNESVLLPGLRKGTPFLGPRVLPRYHAGRYNRCHDTLVGG
ncbi:MAG: DUF3592 domain-containing protein [Gemmatimonadota bacterium]